MDLNSLENIKLLCNCIAIEVYRLDGRVDRQSPEIQKKITQYNNLFCQLTAKPEYAEVFLKTPEVFQKNPPPLEDLLSFNQQMLSTPPKEILKHYTELTKQAMLESNTYDEEKFNRFKSVFYADFKHNLEPKNWEEEPEDQISQYLTEDMKETLTKFEALFQAYKGQFVSLEQFKIFSKQFKDLVKLLGKAKFQQYFNHSEKIILNMNILSDYSKPARPFYEIAISLLDKNQQKSNTCFREPVPTFPVLANYFQNLCYSYLEATKFANIELNQTTSPDYYQSLLKQQMTVFSECYQKLKEMANLKLNISLDNKIIFSDETNYVSELDNNETIACNTNTIDEPLGKVQKNVI